MLQRVLGSAQSDLQVMGWERRSVSKGLLKLCGWQIFAPGCVITDLADNGSICSVFSTNARALSAAVKFLPDWDKAPDNHTEQGLLLYEAIS